MTTLIYLLLGAFGFTITAAAFVAFPSRPLRLGVWLMAVCYWVAVLVFPDRAFRARAQAARSHRDARRSILRKLTSK